MSDVIDRANDLASKETESAIASARAADDQGPVFTGHCLNCGAAVERPRRWCDAECRDEWQEFS